MTENTNRHRRPTRPASPRRTTLSRRRSTESTSQSSAPKSNSTRNSGTRDTSTQSNSPRSNAPRSNSSRSNTQRNAPKREYAKQTKTYKAPNGDVVRVIVLGGLEEVGRNCTLIEYKNDIILIDMGLQFPDENMPGVDYIIPDMSYLKGKEKNVRGVIITHGHYDHIGAIPHVVPNIGNPPIYALPMAAGIIKKRQTDFRTSKINLKQITIDTELKLGVFKVHFFHINHNIPDSAGIVVETPGGTICHTGDWKFDYHPVGAPPADLKKIARVGEQGVALLMGDSTNADRPGTQISERVIGKELEGIIEKAQGRVIVATFASLLSRVKQIIEISEKLGRKVALEGYSMKANVEIARGLGYIKAKDRTIIPINRAKAYPDDKITIICTGAQGEENAALNRIATDSHRFIKVNKRDTIVFSSSVIPGNEQSVQRLKDTFYRKRARVIHKDIMDVHAGGHAMQEDIKLMLSLFTPKYYMPIEGNHFLLRENQMVALDMGYPEERTFVADNGQILELWQDKKGESQMRMTKEKVPTNYVFVDGIGVGDVSDVVIRDRKALSEDGVVVVMVQLDKKTGKVLGKPDIVSRGFVHMKENRKLIDQVRMAAKKAAENLDKKSAPDRETVRNQVRDEVGKILLSRTKRRPMILPVLLEV